MLLAEIYCLLQIVEGFCIEFGLWRGSVQCIGGNTVQNIGGLLQSELRPEVISPHIVFGSVFGRNKILCCQRTPSGMIGPEGQQVGENFAGIVYISLYGPDFDWRQLHAVDRLAIKRQIRRAAQGGNVQHNGAQRTGMQPVSLLQPIIGSQHGLSFGSQIVGADSVSVIKLHGSNTGDNHTCSQKKGFDGVMRLLVKPVYGVIVVPFVPGGLEQLIQIRQAEQEACQKKCNFSNMFDRHNSGSFLCCFK